MYSGNRKRSNSFEMPSQGDMQFHQGKVYG
jgi:hypothetical protein